MECRLGIAIKRIEQLERERDEARDYLNVNVRAALDPFHRVASMMSHFKYDEETPLRSILPGIWPTFADLRKLVKVVPR